MNSLFYVTMQVPECDETRNCREMIQVLSDLASATTACDLVGLDALLAQARALEVGEHMLTDAMGRCAQLGLLKTQSEQLLLSVHDSSAAQGISDLEILQLKQLHSHGMYVIYIYTITLITIVTPPV